MTLGATCTSEERSRLVWDVGLTLLVLAAAYGLKRHYSAATATELRWVLAPTTTLVERITGEPFTLEPPSGYVSTKLHTAIAPACAGVNHLIIALVTLTFGFLRELRTPAGKCAWVAASAVAAYAATLLVNATRIAAGIALHERGLGAAWASPAALHRVEGVVVYLGSLWLLFLGAEALLARVPARTARAPRGVP